jgi:hypothetical protein
MNYQNVYNSLIAKAKSRIVAPDCYCEIHHIVPRALGGTNDPDNLVKLTGREHFVAHMLLAKIHNGPMIIAAFLMAQHGRYTSRTYEWLKKIHSEEKRKQMLGYVASPETRRKISEKLKGRKRSNQHNTNLSKALTGRKLSKEHSDKIRLFFTGRKHSEESKKKISDSQLGEKNHRYGTTMTEEQKEIIRMKLVGIKKGPMSDETKEKLRIIKRGKAVSEETKEKLRLAITGIKRSDETKQKLSESWIARREKIRELKRLSLYVPTTRPRRSEKEINHTDRLKQLNTGRKHNKESKMNMSAAQKGKIVSEETKEKIRQTSSGQKKTIDHIQNMKDSQQIRRSYEMTNFMIETIINPPTSFIDRYKKCNHRKKIQQRSAHPH